MTANLLNASFFQPTGAAGAAGGVGQAGGQAAGAGGAIAGFEALLAAMFGQPGGAEGALAVSLATAQASAQAAATGGKTAVAGATDTPGQPQAGDKGDKAKDGKDSTSAGDVWAAAQALAASAAAAPTTAIVPIATTAKAPADDALAADADGDKPQTAAPAAPQIDTAIQTLPPTPTSPQGAQVDTKAKPSALPGQLAETAPETAFTVATPEPAPSTQPASLPVQKTEAAPASTAPPVAPAQQADPTAPDLGLVKHAAATPPPRPPAVADAPQTPAVELAQAAPATPLAETPPPLRAAAPRERAVGKTARGEPQAAGGIHETSSAARTAGAKAEPAKAEAAATAGGDAAPIEEAEAADRRPDDAARGPTGSDTAPPNPQIVTPQAPHAAAAAVRGAPQTVANLAAQIVRKLEAKTTRFDVELDPAGLGKVNVRVEIGAEGRMTAALACHTPEAQAELKARSGELQRALEQSGFDVSGGLSFEMAGGQNGQAGAGQQQQDSGQAFRGRAFQTALETAGDAAQAAADGALRLSASRFAGVDIRI